MDLQAIGRIPKRRIDQAALALTVIVGAAMAIAFVGRGVSALQHVNSQEAVLVDRLHYLNEVASMLGEGEETLSFLQERTERLNERLPERMDYQSFFAQLAGLAEREGVELIEVQPQEIRTAPDYLELPITLEAEAAYENLYAFLHKLGGMERLVKVHAIEIGMTDRPPVCAIEADLRIYAVNVVNRNG